MTVSIELKLAAKPGALAKMYVGFNKVDVIPNILAKEPADSDGFQRMVVEFEDDVTPIDIVLEQLSHVDVLQVIGVKGAAVVQKPQEKITVDEKEVFKVSTEHKEQIAPASESEKIDIFDNHRGRRDKF